MIQAEFCVMQKNMLMKISKSIAVAVTIAMTASMPVTALAAPANFNAAYYAAHNPDAVKVFGNDPAKLFEHFIIYGLSEGRTPYETFNADTFFSENKEMAVLVAAAFADKPEVVNSPILQVAREVSTTYIPAPVSAPEKNNVYEGYALFHCTEIIFAIFYSLYFDYLQSILSTAPVRSAKVRFPLITFFSPIRSTKVMESPSIERD